MSCSRPASKLTGGEHFPDRKCSQSLERCGTTSIFDIFNQQAFLAAECCLNEIHTLCELLLTDEGHDVSDAETI